MDTPSPAWLPLFTSLAVELTVVVALALAIQPALKSAPGRRALWQVTLVSLALVTLVELSGMGRSAWTWVAHRLEEKQPVAADQTVAADVRRRTFESPNRLLPPAATPLLPQRLEIATAPVAVRVSPVVVAQNVAWWPGMLWLAGFALLALRVLVARALFTLFQRLRQAGVLDLALLERVQALARRMGLRRRVRVTHTSGLAGPIAFGICRPCVSLPVDFQERFSGTQQQAMLAHELAHLAAGDPAWHLLADLVAALLWWHPLAWWSRRQLRSACEAAADEASLLVENGPHALAECLVALGGRLARTHSLGGLGIEGDDFRSGLGRRVKRLLDLKGQSWRPWRRSRQWLLTSFCPVILVVLVLAGTSWVQPREAKSETPGQSFEKSVLGLAWSSILQVSLKNSERGAAGSVEPEKIDWQPWSEAAVAQARADGRPVLVHFTADWAVTAQANEKTSLDIPSVREKLRTLGAAALRADCTRPTEVMTAELRTHQRVGVPLTLVYSPDPNVPPQVLPALLTPDLVLQALDQTRQAPSRPVDSLKGADTRKNDAPTLILQGKTLLDAGKLAEAEGKLKEALKLDPANKAAAYYLALAEAQHAKTTTPKAGGVPLLSELPLLGRLFATNARPNSDPPTIEPYAGIPPLSELPSAGKRPVTNAPDKDASALDAVASPPAPESPVLHTRWFTLHPNTLAANLREMMGSNAVPARTVNTSESALTDLKQVLAATGVEMSPPKTMFFNDRLGQLLVRATLSDLEAIERLIQALNTSPPQVVIEVRFCEMTEEDGKSLGFDWLPGNASGGSTPSEGGLAPSPGIASKNNGVSFGVGNGVAPLSPTVTGILTEPQFRVVLRALEQRRGVNLLTAPKVTTLSGRQAQIKTVEVRYIVTDLDFNTNAASPSAASAESVGIQPIAQPFELGPVIDLVPYVAADGFTIHLTVIASIKEFVGYENKEGFLATLRSGKSEPQTSPTPLPKFRLRQVVTSAVVWDGQTLVLSGGSMAFEEVGEKTAPPGASGSKGATRLLRPNAASRQRKSLLVFVTPTIIDPAGNRVHSPGDLPIRKNSVPPQKAATVK